MKRYAVIEVRPEEDETLLETIWVSDEYTAQDYLNECKLGYRDPISDDADIFFDELPCFHIVDDCGVDVYYHSFFTKEEALHEAENLTIKQLSVHDVLRRKNLYVIEGDLDNTDTWKDICVFIKDGVIQRFRKDGDWNYVQRV